MKALSVMIVVLTVVLHNCLQSAFSQDSVFVYHCERGQFTISLPTGWTKQEQDLGESGLFVTGSPKESDKDLYREGINIISSPSIETDLSKVNSEGIEGMKKLALFSLVDQGIGKMGQNSTAWFIFTFSDLKQTEKYKFIKYYLIHGGKMNIVTCSALPETFKHYLPYFKSIIGSIVFD